MDIMYSTSAISTGGRDGKVVVENSTLEFEMALPSQLGGGKKEGANPEQLFAAGYCACFGSALQHVLREMKIKTDIPKVQITVGIGKNEAGGFSLKVDIISTFTGIDQQLADSIIKEAHNVCPYSNATKGNIEVSLTAKVN